MSHENSNGSHGGGRGSSEDLIEFKRKHLRVAVNKSALIQLDEEVVEGVCIDIDSQALAVELPLHSVQHGQLMIVNVEDFLSGEKLKIKGTVVRVDVFTSNLTGNDTLLIVCKFDQLDPTAKGLIESFLSDGTVDVASW